VKSNGSSSSFLYFSTTAFPWKSALSRIARSIPASLQQIDQELLQQVQGGS